MATKKKVYRVTFVNQAELYEVYAREVRHGSLFGFVEVEELLFGEKSQVVIDPSEDKLKHEFEGVKRTYVPIHSIVRIDEVEKQGTSRVAELPEGGSVSRFPGPVYPPAQDPGSKR